MRTAEQARIDTESAIKSKEIESFSYIFSEIEKSIQEGVYSVSIKMNITEKNIKRLQDLGYIVAINPGKGSLYPLPIITISWRE